MTRARSPLSSGRVAVLDIGSNSVRLLVADVSAGQVFSVCTEKVTTRLLAGFKDGWLQEDAIERTYAAILALRDRAVALSAGPIVGFGTSALRDGKNRDVLIRRARDIGVEVEVMSGEQEAALAYAGAAPRGKRGVLDIGGGSTELLIGLDGQVQSAYSAQMGAVRLLEMAGGSDDPARMKALARHALAPACDLVGEIVDSWVGVGGTVTALSAMCLGLSVYDPARIEGHRLSAQAVERWLHSLCRITVTERRQLPGLTPERADIIPCGAAILLAFFELGPVDHVLASDRDNLLGYIAQKFCPLH